MGYLETIRPFFTSYYVLNVLASVSYVVLKTSHPICEWFFTQDEQCELSLVCLSLSRYSCSKIILKTTNLLLLLL